MIDSGPRFSLSCQRKAAAGAVEKKALVFSDTLCNPRKPLPSAPNPVPLQMVFPACRTLAVNGVQPPDGRYCSFRCRWPGVPGQRAAKRNARKEKLVTSDQHPQIRHAESHAGAWNCKRRCPAHLAEAFRASRAASEKTPVFAPWPVPWGISGFLFHRARRILFFKREWGAQFPRHQPVTGAKRDGRVSPANMVYW